MEDRTIQICKQLAEWIATTADVEVTGEPNIYMTSLVKVNIFLGNIAERKEVARKLTLVRIHWSWQECCPNFWRQTH